MALTGNVLATRYELIERLSEGLLFDVYRARDLVQGRVVTVKLVRSPYHQNPRVCERLQQVVDARLRLRHPNLITLYSLEDEDGQLFLVEEFVRGLDLATRIRRTAPFTVPIAVEIMIGIVEGLNALHRAGLVHGDLRPANVLVGSEWHVWLNGSEMRGVYQADPTLSAAHEARMVTYTAPEVLRGATPSVASDLYACGVIFFEMLVGAPPFTGDTPLMIAEAHEHEPVPSLRARNPAVPRAVEGIVTKCLQKSPEARYPDALALLNDLKAVRDALRFGRPLGWSPMETAAPIASLPTGSAISFAAQPPLARPATEEESEEDIPGWLRTMLRVMVILVVLGLIICGAIMLALRVAPEDRPVPPVVGKTLQEANQMLLKAGFEPEVKQEGYSEQYPPGVVYSVSPPEGRLISRGSKVYLWVSKGSKFTTVPDVRNLPESRARAELERAGLAVMDATEERTSAQIPFGFVIGTIPPAGSRIDRSQPIKLIISVGQGAFTPPAEEPSILEQPSTPPPQQGEDESLNPPGQPKLREFVVKVDLTDQPDRTIRIEVEDAHGTRTVVNERKVGGSIYEFPIQAHGERVRIRVFVDNQLVQEIAR
ncbi:Serine/threonine-protein kinase StkP [bacterium HR15]|nr:Serine/threonine-protein kinase StkP [bacterium HR15]